MDVDVAAHTAHANALLAKVEKSISQNGNVDQTASFDVDEYLAGCSLQMFLKTKKDVKLYSEHYNRLKKMEKAIDAHVAEREEVEKMKEEVDRDEAEMDFYSKKKVELMRHQMELRSRNKETEEMENATHAVEKNNMQLEALFEQKKSNFEKQKVAREERNAPKQEEKEEEKSDHSDAEEAVNDPETRGMVQMALLFGSHMKLCNLTSNHFEQKIEEWKTMYPDLASDKEDDGESSGFESQGETGHIEDNVSDSEQKRRDFQSLFGPESPTRKSRSLSDTGASRSSPHKKKHKVQDSSRTKSSHSKQPSRKKETADGETQTILKSWKLKLKVMPPNLVTQSCQTDKPAKNSVENQCQTDELDFELPVVDLLDEATEEDGYATDVSDDPAGVEPSGTEDFCTLNQSVEYPDPPILTPQISQSPRKTRLLEKLLTPEEVSEIIESESKKFSVNKNNKDLQHSVADVKSTSNIVNDLGKNNVLAAVFKSKNQTDSPATSIDKTSRSAKKKKSVKCKSTFKSNMSCVSSIICNKRGTWKHSWHLNAWKSINMRKEKLLRQKESSDSESIPEVNIRSSPKDSIGFLGTMKEIEKDTFYNTPKSKLKKALTRKSTSKSEKKKNVQKKPVATSEAISEPSQTTRRSSRLSTKSVSKVTELKTALKKTEISFEDTTIEPRQLRPRKKINYGSPTDSVVSRAVLTTVNISTKSRNIELKSNPKNPPSRRSSSLSAVEATIANREAKTPKKTSQVKHNSSSKVEAKTVQVEVKESARTLRMKLRSRRRNSISSIVEAKAIHEKTVIQEDQTNFKSPAASKTLKIKTRPRRNSTSSIFEPTAMENDQMVFKNPAEKTTPTRNSNIVEAVQKAQMVFKKPADKTPQMSRTSPRNITSGTVEPTEMQGEKMATTATQTMKLSSSSKVQPKTDQVMFKKPANKMQMSPMSPRNSSSSTFEPETMQTDQMVLKKPATKLRSNLSPPTNIVEPNSVQRDQLAFKKPENKIQPKVAPPKPSTAKTIEPRPIQKEDKPKTPASSTFKMRLRSRRNSISSIVEVQAMQKEAQAALQTQNKTSRTKRPRRNSICSTLEAEAMNTKKSLRTSNTFSSQTDLTNCGTLEKSVHNTTETKSTDKFRKTVAKECDVQEENKGTEKEVNVKVQKTGRKDSQKSRNNSSKSNSKTSQICNAPVSKTDGKVSQITAKPVAPVCNFVTPKSKRKPPPKFVSTDQLQQTNSSRRRSVLCVETSSRWTDDNFDPLEAEVDMSIASLSSVTIALRDRVLHSSHGNSYPMMYPPNMYGFYNPYQFYNPYMPMYPPHGFPVPPFFPAQATVEPQNDINPSKSTEPNTESPQMKDLRVVLVDYTLDKKRKAISSGEETSESEPEISQISREVTKSQEKKFESTWTSNEFDKQPADPMPPKNLESNPKAVTDVKLQLGGLKKNKKVKKSKKQKLNVPSSHESDVEPELATQSQDQNVQPIEVAISKNPVTAVDWQSGSKKITKSIFSESDEEAELSTQSNHQNVQSKEVTMPSKDPAGSLKSTTDEQLKPDAKEKSEKITTSKQQEPVPSSRNRQLQLPAQPSKDDQKVQPKTTTDAKLQPSSKKKQKEPVENNIIVTQADVHSSLEGLQSNDSHSKSATPHPEKIISTVKNTNPALDAIESAAIPIPAMFTRSKRRVKPTYKSVCSKMMGSVGDKKPKRKPQDTKIMKNAASKTKVKEQTVEIPVKNMERHEGSTAYSSSVIENYPLSSAWSQEVDSIFMPVKTDEHQGKKKRKLTDEEKKLKKTDLTDKKSTKRKEKNSDNNLEVKKVALSKDTVQEKSVKDKKLFKVPSEYHKQMVKKRYPNNTELQMREECAIKNQLVQKRIHLSDSDESVSLKYSGKRRRRARVLSEGASDSSDEYMEKRLKELQNREVRSSVKKLRRIQVVPCNSPEMEDESPTASPQNCLMNPAQVGCNSTAAGSGNASRHTQKKRTVDDDSSDSNHLVIDEVSTGSFTASNLIYEDLKLGAGVQTVDLLGGEVRM